MKGKKERCSSDLQFFGLMLAHTLSKPFLIWVCCIFRMCFCYCLSLKDLSKKGCKPTLFSCGSPLRVQFRFCMLSFSCHGHLPHSKENEKKNTLERTFSRPSSLLRLPCLYSSPQSIPYSSLTPFSFVASLYFLNLLLHHPSCLPFKHAWSFSLV